MVQEGLDLCRCCKAIGIGVQMQYHLVSAGQLMGLLTLVIGRNYIVRRDYQKKPWKQNLGLFVTHWFINKERLFRLEVCHPQDLKPWKKDLIPIEGWKKGLKIYFNYFNL
jgi:hypothetical protein